MKASEHPIAEVMTSTVICLEAFSQVESALTLAAEKGAHHFPVLSGGKVVGFVCTCDLEDAPLTAPVGSVMRRPVVSMGRLDTAGDAARLMAEHGVGSAVVMDGEDVCGIVTRLDLDRVGGDLVAMIDSACASCGTHQHLRTCPDGATLCVDCRSRARDHEAYELGG